MTNVVEVIKGIASCSCPGRLGGKEAELTFSFAVVVRPSICTSVICRLSSVTIVHPTQAIEMFGNVSTPFGTLTICELR